MSGIDGGGVPENMAASFSGGMQASFDVKGVAGALQQELQIHPELAQKFAQDLVAAVAGDFSFFTPSLEEPQVGVDWGEYNDMIREVAKQASVEVKESAIVADGSINNPVGASTASVANRADAILAQGEAGQTNPEVMKAATDNLSPALTTGAIISALQSVQSEDLVRILQNVAQAV